MQDVTALTQCSVKWVDFSCVRINNNIPEGEWMCGFVVVVVVARKFRVLKDLL